VASLGLTGANMEQTKRHAKSATPDWVKTCWSQVAPHAEIFRTDQQHCEINASLHLRDPGYSYARGFHIGGQILANYVSETQHDMDVLVFPIVFLYRHHVELMLKRLIDKGAKFTKKTLSVSEKGALAKHRLDPLWNTLRPILNTAIPLLPAKVLKGIDPSKVLKGIDPSKVLKGIDPSKVLKGIDPYIQQLRKVDPKGESFRYHISTEGKRHLVDLCHINVRIFAEAMEWLSCILEGFDCMFDDKIDVLDQKAREAHDY
jgi:hypothetical protein